MGTMKYFHSGPTTMGEVDWPDRPASYSEVPVLSLPKPIASRVMAEMDSVRALKVSALKSAKSLHLI